MGEGDHGTESCLGHRSVCPPGHVLEGRQSLLSVVAQRDSNAVGRRNACCHPDVLREVKTCWYAGGESLIVSHGEVHPWNGILFQIGGFLSTGPKVHQRNINELCTLCRVYIIFFSNWPKSSFANRTKVLSPIEIISFTNRKVQPPDFFFSNWPESSFANRKKVLSPIEIISFANRKVQPPDFFFSNWPESSFANRTVGSLSAKEIQMGGIRSVH